MVAAAGGGSGAGGEPRSDGKRTPAERRRQSGDGSLLRVMGLRRVLLYEGRRNYGPASRFRMLTHCSQDSNGKNANALLVPHL
jgi:hypothetical protein